MTTLNERTTMTDLTLAISEIVAERIRQDEQRGAFRDLPDGTGTKHIYRAQMDADTANAQANNAAATGILTWRDLLLRDTFAAIAEEDPEQLDEALTELGALVIEWKQDLDRRRMEPVHASRAGRR